MPRSPFRILLRERRLQSDEIAPVFGHGLMSDAVGSFDGLRYAPPILRELAYAIKNGLA